MCVMVYLADIRGAKSQGSIILWSTPSPSAMSIESTTQTRNIPIDLDFPFFSLSPLLFCVYYLERDGLSPWVYGWLCVFVFLHRCHNTQPAPPPTAAAAADKSRVCVYTQAKAKTGKLHMEAFTLSPHTFLFRSLACDGYMALSLFDPTLIFFILFCTRGIHPAIRKNLGRRHSRSLVLKKNA